MSELAKEMKVAALDSSIGSGALYVATVTPALYSCAGGVVTGWEGDAAGKVLSSGKKPIDGLYAAGEATSSPYAKLWSISGVPLLYSVYSGRMAGKAAAGEGKTVTDLREVIISCLTSPTKLVEACGGVKCKLIELLLGHPLNLLTWLLCRNTRVSGLWRLCRSFVYTQKTSITKFRRRGGPGVAKRGLRRLPMPARPAFVQIQGLGRHFASWFLWGHSKQVKHDISAPRRPGKSIARSALWQCWRGRNSSKSNGWDPVSQVVLGE